MPPTRVVHVNDEVPDAIYIGRAVSSRHLPPSPWACSYRVRHAIRHTEACLRFGDALLAGPRRCQLAELPALRGKPLACWCRHESEPRRPWNACHGDILVGLLERYSDDELRALAVRP
jgi:hypothetical protein